MRKTMDSMCRALHHAHINLDNNKIDLRSIVQSQCQTLIEENNH